MNSENSAPTSTCSVAPVVNSSDAGVGTTASMAMTSLPHSLTALSCTSSSQAIISTPVTSTSSSPSNQNMLQPPPPPTPVPPTPAPTVVAPQASPVHQNMVHPPFSNVTPTPLSQVQVIQQPIHGSTYLQHLYTSQQQMLLPGNLTVQPAGVAQTLQSLGTAPGVNLQLQNKTSMDPKSGGSTIIPASVQNVSTTGKGMALSSPNLVTATGQVIATGGKTCMPGPMITAAKSTAVLQGQTGFVPSTTSSQTVVIGQFGMLSNQASIVPSHNKTISDSQKGKPFMMGQPAALQPKSPILPCPVSSSNATAQVLTNTQLKQLTSSPQLIASQAPTAMIASQAQILGSLQALGASLPQGITWAAHGGLQSPTLLTQNPIFIRSQQPDMFIQSPSPATAYAVPMASTTPSSHMTVIPTTPYLQKQKQVRPASSVATQTAVSTAAAAQSRAPPNRTQAKQRSRGQNNRSSPGGLQPPPPQTVTIQTQTPPLQHQKADAANQTKPTPEMKSTATQSKSVATETGQQVVLAKQHISPISTVNVLPKPTTVDVKSFPETPVMNNNMSETNMEVDPIPVVDTNPPLKDTATVEPEPIEKPRKEEDIVGIPHSDVISKEKQPQKAIVKPHILTHVIDGYVILEGPDPFPVSRSSLLTDCTNIKPDSAEKPPEAEVSPVAKVSIEEKSQKTSKSRGPVELAKCEFCGKLGAKSKFKRSKRFCSTSCAKRYNVGCSKRLGIFPPASQQTSTTSLKYEGKIAKKKKMGFKTRKGWRKSQGGRLAYNVSEWQNQNTTSQTDQRAPIEIESEESVKEEREAEGETTDTPSGPESSMSPTTPSSHKEEMEVDGPEPTSVVSSNPLKWTVQEVVDFIHGLPGCADYADEFRSQEIDGQALLLLKEDHLMTAMSMKLGPALKICACIKSLKQGIDGKCQQ